MEFIDFSALKRSRRIDLIFPDWKKGENVTFYSPHDDDAVLGAGYLIQAVSENGGRPFIIVFCRGDAGYSTAKAKATIVATRKEEAIRAYGELGVEKDAPYFVSETRMTVEKDLGVIALRNDEMVLYKKLFDTLIYKDRQGEIVKRPLIELPGRPFGLAHVAPANLEWVGLVNSVEKYGFFSIRLAEASANLEAAGDFSHNAGTYFYAPSDGEYVYAVRAYLYTWADYMTSTQLTFLPQGSFFYEKNAYVLFPWDDKTIPALDELARKLKNPLRVF